MFKAEKRTGQKKNSNKTKARGGRTAHHARRHRVAGSGLAKRKRNATRGTENKKCDKGELLGELGPTHTSEYFPLSPKDGSE